MFTLAFVVLGRFFSSFFQGSVYSYFLSLLVSILISYSVGEFGPDVVNALKVRGQKPKDAEKVAMPCGTCGKPMEFIQEYERWFCYNCKAYG